MKRLAIILGLLIPLTILAQDLSKDFAFYSNKIHFEDGARSFNIDRSTMIIRSTQDDGQSVLSIIDGAIPQEFNIDLSVELAEDYYMFQISNTETKGNIYWMGDKFSLALEDGSDIPVHREYMGLSEFTDQYNAYISAMRDPDPLAPSNLIREGTKYETNPDYTEEELIEFFNNFGDGKIILEGIKTSFFSGEIEL